MPIYFRKSVKIAPGLHLNFSKRGMGMSLGARGGPRLTLGPTGRLTASQHLGFGMRYQESVSLKKKAPRKSSANSDYAESNNQITNSDHDNPYGTTIHREHHGFWASYGTWTIISFWFSANAWGTNASRLFTGIVTGIFIIFLGLFLVDTFSKS